MKRAKEQRTKNSSPLRHFSLLPFSFSLALDLFHPSSFLFGFMCPARFVTWQRNCPIGRQTLFHTILLLSSHLRATGYSHLALPTGESLFGGDSQAQMFVGSDYSSLPSSSRVNRVSILTLRIFIRLPKGARLVDFSGSIPDGMTELVE